MSQSQKQTLNICYDVFLRRRYELRRTLLLLWTNWLMFCFTR